jgi:DNA-binding NarL/FixJ family response regulator
MADVARVLIAEDEKLWSGLLRTALSGEEGIETVGWAEGGETAVSLARQLRPDAVIMDIEFVGGGIDGIEAALQIKSERPETGIVILSAHADRRYVTSLPLAEKPGWSYLLKQFVPDVATVVRAIRASMNGMVMLAPEVVNSLQPRKATALARLTPRQYEVLKWMAEGYNNAAIANRLTLVEKSVETYINGIYQELGLSGEPGIHARVKAAILFLEESQSSPAGPSR